MQQERALHSKRAAPSKGQRARRPWVVSDQLHRRAREGYWAKERAAVTAACTDCSRAEHRASGRLRASHCELPLPGPASPLPHEHSFVPSTTYSVGWAGLCPHPRETGLDRPGHIPDSVFGDLLALCKPKAGQTYISQAFLTFLLLSSQWSIFLWKGQNSADEHPLPALCIFSLLYLLVICLCPSSVKVVSLTFMSDWISSLKISYCLCLPHTPSLPKGWASQIPGVS